MATIPIFTPAGERAGELELAAEVFGLEPNKALMHQAVVSTLANMRQGTADTKTRAEVHHTTKKLFKQKGTGRARQGMRSAPHWKGGGIAFGPHPRDYSVSFPKKMRRKALLSALSSKLTSESITVVEHFGITEAKTKQAIALLSALQLSGKKLLVVLDEPTEALVLAFRNIPNVYLTTVEMLGTYDVLSTDRLLFTQAGITLLQELKQQPIGMARWMANQQQGGAA
ncbi:MAG TPA: 50S ribosomal protein L4 [Armatimonadota bacterium]|jgi:large subunit ribosomal protein L4